MLRMRICRSIRTVLCLLLAFALFSVAVHLGLRTSPTSTRPAPVNEYLLHPTYEYTSLCRNRANKTLETELNDQLLTLEHSIRRSLPPSQQSLVANHTIWQIASGVEASRWNQWTEQWKEVNKEWAYSLVTSPPTHLLSLFSTTPSVTTAYEERLFLRTDLLKYLLLWYHGGFYVDINAWARLSLRDCAPLSAAFQARRDVSLMVGVDIDEPFFTPKSAAQYLWTRNFGFGSKVVFAPKRFDPILRTAIVRSISHSIAMESVKPRAWDGSLLGKDQAQTEISGASMFTDVVLEVLSEGLRDDHPLRDRDAGLERRVTWKWFRRLKKPVWIETADVREDMLEGMRGLAVLPINIWGNGQKHSGAGREDVGDACVNI